eukprot:g6888.t1 g6888   contig23:1421918-1424271(-)
MADVQCPPYYSAPTIQQTLTFTTGSNVRHYNDWYRCIQGPYCNAPSFLGYNPPGEGDKWNLAWEKLDEGFPCNSNLDTALSTPSGGGVLGDFVLTKRPTQQPTTEGELPSLISGVVWYDANGDGRRNTPNIALTVSDFQTSESERGAGISNMRVTLRQCGDDMLVGVTYTFHVDCRMELPFSVEITWRRFKRIHTKLEVLVGYRLTGGNGYYWEVHEEALNAGVVPMVEKSSSQGRDLQEFDGMVNETVYDPVEGDVFTNDTAISDTLNGKTSSSNSNGGGTGFTIYDPSGNSNEQSTIYPTSIKPNIDGFTDSFDSGERNATLLGPITHSGYFARSRCISIAKGPTQVNQVDAGMAQDSWPLKPFQYASMVVTIQYYLPTRRELQAAISLECRDYQKLKGEGIEVEDIWGCEKPLTAGGPRYDFEELTMEQGDLFVKGMEEFLKERTGQFTVRNVGLTHQEMILLESKRNRSLQYLSNWMQRRRGKSSDLESLEYDRIGNTYNLRGGSQSNGDLSGRDLQANKEIARLDVGFRLRGESDTQSTEDFTEVVTNTILSGQSSLLAILKASIGLPSYFKLAGGVLVRRDLFVPGVKEEEVVQVDEIVEPPPSNNGVSMGAIFGIVFAVVALAGITAGVFVYRRRRVEMYDSDSDSSSSSDYSDSDDYSSDSSSDSDSSSSDSDSTSDDGETTQSESMPPSLRSRAISRRARFAASKQPINSSRPRKPRQSSNRQSGGFRQQTRSRRVVT